MIQPVEDVMMIPMQCYLYSSYYRIYMHVNYITI